MVLDQVSINIYIKSHYIVLNYIRAQVIQFNIIIRL